VYNQSKMLFIFSLLTSATVAQDISSCCTRISIKSTGEASNHQKNRLGQYQLTGILNSRPKYSRVDESGGEEHLFYLRSRNKGLWMVGPSAGQFNGGLAHRGDTLCVEDVNPGQWKYTDGRSWNLDSEITVSCLDSVADEEPKCEYNDQTEYQGEDLPELYGGGGVETNPSSSIECIKLCESTAGCNYWTYVMEAKVNCFLKKRRGTPVRKPKHVSGSDPRACSYTPAITTTTERIFEEVSNDIEEPVYNENEINGKFKIMMGWDQKFNDPESEEFKSLANSIENDLEDMLRQERDLSDQVEEFTVKVQKFRKGSVVCDFKVNYILKEAYIAIPFAIKPANITDSMNKNFKFKKGILFQRFLIAGGSFNASSPVDHCAAKGCSHKCDYNYDVEDYICTCPRDLQLAEDGLNCISEQDEKVTVLYDGPKEETETTKSETETTTKSEIELTLLPTNCLWGPWSDWAKCSVTCGKGQRERTRSVAIPAKNGGACNGEDKEFVECEFACEDETATEDSLDSTTSADEEVTESKEIAESDVDQSIATTTEPKDGLPAAIDGITNAPEVISTTVIEQDEKTDSTTPVIEADVKIVLPEDQTESTVASTDGINFEEATIPAIIEDEEFGMKLDETTTVSGTIDGDDEDVKEDESTPDSSIIFPLPQNPETTTIMQMTDDMAATISVNEDELNPSTVQTESPESEESSDDAVQEVSTAKTDEEETTPAGEIMEDAISTEDVLKARIDDIPSITTIDDTESTTATATEMITDSPLEIEVDTTTITNELDDVSDAVDEKTTEAEVETATVKDDMSMISTTPAEEQTVTDSEVKDMEPTTSLPAIDSTIDDTTKTTDNIDDYEVLEEETQEVTTDSSLPSEVDPTMSDDAVETTTKLDMETTTAVKDTEEKLTEESIIEEEDVSSTVSSVTEMISDEEMTTQKVEEKMMDGETTTSVAGIETDDVTTPEVETDDVTTPEVDTDDATTPEIDTEIEEKIMEDETTTSTSEIETTTPQEIGTEVPLKPAMPRLDTSEEVSTTVVIEEVPAITTESNIDSLSLVTEREETTADTTLSSIIEPSEETESDVDVSDTTTMTSVDTSSVDTGSEGEDTETTLSPINKQPLDTSSEIEVPETTVTPTDTSSVTVISVSEEDDMVTIVTMRPTTVQQSDIDVSSVETTTILSDVTMVTEGPESTADDVPATTTMQSTNEDETSTLSDQEFLCTQTDDIMENNEDIPMKCKHTTGDEEKTVFLIIPKESLGDVTLDRLFDKNVKIIVKDFMIMDRSPRRL